MARTYLGTSVRLTQEQLNYCEMNGGKSKLIRKLIDKDMGMTKLVNDLINKYGKQKALPEEAHN